MDKESEFYKKLESNGWIEAEHVGHILYEKGPLTYSPCCETLWYLGGDKDMTQAEFEKEYLTITS